MSNKYRIQKSASSIFLCHNMLSNLYCVGGDPITWYTRRYTVHRSYGIREQYILMLKYCMAGKLVALSPSLPDLKLIVALENPKLQFRSGEDRGQGYETSQPETRQAHSTRLSAAMEMMCWYICSRANIHTNKLRCIYTCKPGYEYMYYWVVTFTYVHCDYNLGRSP